MSAALQAVRTFRIRELTPFFKADPKLSNARPKLQNPFIPHKNPESGRWAPSKYSLRQQADLVRSARVSGMLHLLPPGPKLSTKELASATATASTASPTTSAVGSEGPLAADIAEVSSSAGESASTSAPASEQWWTAEIEWEGEAKEKEVKGADVGNRLYAGKKRMFKGHKWERTLEKRTRERKMLMKSMESRIERFKTNYRRKTPSPVSPARPVSYSKLPF